MVSPPLDVTPRQHEATVDEVAQYAALASEALAGNNYQDALKFYRGLSELDPDEPIFPHIAQLLMNQEARP